MRGEFVDLRGARLYYYAAGTRGAGEPIVLLHGFPTSSYLWRAVVPLLPVGHRVVVPDLLGFGRSDPPLSRDVSARGHGSMVLALLDALGIAQACIVGHGFGGMVAQRIAMTAPERVTRLGLVNTLAADGRPFADAPRICTLATIASALPLRWLVAALRKELLRGYADPISARHSVDHYLRPFGSPGGSEALAAHLRALRRASDEDEAPSMCPEAIAAPTSIVGGRDDPFVPVGTSQGLRVRITNATLELIAGGRHYAPEESCERVSGAVATLLSRTPARVES